MHLDIGRISPTDSSVSISSSRIADSGKAGEQVPVEPKEEVQLGKQLYYKKPEESVHKLKPGEYYAKALRHDVNELKDGYDASRDIQGVYAKEGAPDEPYQFRVDLVNLRPGAEHGNLDIYALISIAKEEGRRTLPDNIPGSSSIPWQIAIGAYDNNNFKAINHMGQTLSDAVSGVRFNPLHSSVSFNVSKNALSEAGWEQGQPLQFQIFTAKDHNPVITDSFDEPTKKPWVSDNKLGKYLDTSKPGSVIAPRNQNWSDDSIYFLMTDRFHDGDKTNNHKVVPGELTRFQGGDLQGLIDKLDYIKDLGASTIWLTPVMKNQTDFVDSSGYHGYWVVDFYDVDDSLGNMDKFKEFVNKTHEKGMKVILDIPLNHVAWEHPFWTDPEKHDWFHHIGDIVDWNDPYQKENGSMYGLPDLAQENPEVYKYLVEVTKYWIDEGKIDGLRLDAVSHVPKWFWDKYTSEIREYAGPDFFMIGEVINGDPGKISSYQTGGMNSLFDMPLYYSIRDSIAYDGSMKHLAQKISDLELSYENPSMMSSIIDNHDTDRFITMAGNAGKEKAKLALALITTLNRIPSIYYGTEQAMEGRLEKFGVCGPENREMMQFGKDPDMEEFTRKLLQVRNNSEAIKTGAYLEMWKDDQVFGYSRLHPEEEAIVLLNNTYDNQYREIPLRQESNIKDGTILRDALSGREVTVSERKIRVNLGSKQPMLFLPVVNPKA